MRQEEVQAPGIQSGQRVLRNDTYQQTVVEMIEEQVDRSPNTLALVALEGSLTYRDMDRQANQIAHMLEACGQKQRQPVGLCVPPSLLGTLGLLGILKAGCVYVPFDPRLPQERLVSLARQAQIAFVVTVAQTEAIVAGTEVQTLCLDQQWEHIQRQSEKRLRTSIVADDVAYIFFTSGSTGLPKGVMVPHRALLNRLFWGIEDCQLQPGDRLAQIAGWSFDIALWELCAPWLAGATTVLFPSEIVRDPQALLARVHSEQVTVIHVVPSLLALLVQEPTLLSRCTSIRCLMTGGEAVHAQLLERFSQILTSDVHQFYGPTEATISMTCSIIHAGEQRTFIPLGDPITNTQLYLLDQWQQPVPNGIPGEIYIGGMCLARGYWERPDLTAERFVPDPFSQQGGTSLYRTGDLARRLPDGELEYIGRIDDQVKIRGHRIEPGEIESCLQSHPAVQQNAIKIVQNQRGEQQLAAYIVVANASLPTTTLRHYLQQRLPEYMIPTTFTYLDHLPVNHNGKIDRAALPLPTHDTIHTDTPFVAPHTPLQEQVAALWCEVLQISSIGIHDNFFALGGHSLLTIRVLTRLRTTFQIDVPLQMLFEYPTIALLATQIEQIAGVRGAPLLPDIEALPEQYHTTLPLSFAQERFWFLDQLAEGSSFYTIPFAVRLRRPLDHTVFSQSITMLIERHEILRTSFQLWNGQPIQVIAPSMAVTIPLIDISQVEAREQVLQDYCLDLIQTPFELSHAPLLRGRLFHWDKDDYVFALAIHHSVADGWSLAIFMQELLTIYEALLTETVPELPALPIQYKDFACWERMYLTDAYLQPHLAYWQAALADAPALLPLPYDHPRPPVLRYRGAQQFFHLPSSLRTQLQHLSQQANVTLYMTLLATFQVFLARYSGQTDIVLGTVVAGRNHPHLEPLIGCFVNTLAIRIQLDGHPSFTEVLQRVNRVMQQAYAHQEAPFEQVIEALQPERSLSYHPLFQVSFAWENVFYQAPTEAAQQHIEQVHFDTGMSKFDVTLFLWEEETHLVGYFEYNTDLFEAETIRRWTHNFQTLVESCVTTPDRDVFQLPLLHRTEQDHLLSLSHSPSRIASDVCCIHTAFERQTRKTPDNSAITQADTHMTYQQVEQYANQLAHLLHAQGVTTETRVALSLERNPWMVVAILAILKAGGTYVPLDPETPRERLTFIVRDAQCALLITQESLWEHTRHLREETQILCLEQHQEELQRYPTEPLALPAYPEQLAYLIYTSGSTGRPKGAGITHRNLANLVQWDQQNFALSPADRTTHLAGLGFDASVWELWPPLLIGAHIFLVADAIRHDALKLQHLLIQHQITRCFIPTPLLEQLLLLPWPERCTLRQVQAGGDVLHQFPWQDFPFQVSNNYGPTECTVVATTEQITATGSAHLPAIGHPIDNVQVYVLDDLLQLVPQGAIGELYIGGENVGRGYVNQPALTAERFLPDPFGAHKGGRLYRTGDLVRYRADNALEFIGRRDQQIKVRGFRIEIGEIEALLQQYAGIAECVVLLRTEQPELKRLVAYLVPHTNVVLHEEQIQAYLQEHLPAYMVPAAYVFLPALPITQNGKIDRQALPLPEDVSSPQAAQAAPRTPTEERLTYLWREMMDLDQIGIHDNFFALGGHSLLATRLITHMNQEFQLELPLRVLFRTPTIAAIAELIDTTHAASTAHPHLIRQTDGPDFPLSLTQERLWFLYHLDPDSALYNISLHLRLQGILDPVALQKSVDDLVQRHEVLRTTFHMSDGQPRTSWQHIHSALDAPITRLDISTLAPSDRQKEQQRILSHDACAPLDLSNGPLFRLTLITLQDQEHLLLFTLHHIITDAWSLDLLLKDLHHFYSAHAHAILPALPDQRFQYVDYSVWQRQWQADHHLDDQLAYWRRQLTDAPKLLELPTDYPRPVVPTYQGHTFTFSLSPELSSRLRELSQQQEVTLFVILLSAYLVLLSRYSGQTDLVVGTPVAGRTFLDLEEIAGFFVNTLPLRYQLSDQLSYAELLQHVQHVLLDAYAHQDVPFDRIVEALQPERNASYQPLFQVSCAIEMEPVTVHLGDLVVERLSSHTDTAKFDLSLTWHASSTTLQATFEYATDLFTHTTIKQFARTVTTLLEQIVEHPHQQIAQVSLLSAQEKDRLLYHVNATHQPFPMQEDIASLFEAQVQQTPHAPAIVSEHDDALNYAALNERANRLAQYLQAQQVGPETCVGLCAERSLALIIGFLAVLKAGGVYVPLDPHLPPARLQFLLSDAHIHLLLLQERFIEQFSNWSGPLHCLDRDEHQLQLYSNEDPHRHITGQNLAYILYTSGSTGQPKGVAVTHHNIHRLVRDTNYIQITTDDAILHLSNVSFDAATFEIWGALLNGACLILIPHEVVLEPEHFYQRIIEHRGTIAFFTTMLFNQLASFSPHILQQLRVVLFGGERADPHAVHRVLQQKPESLLHVYGPTENTTFSTFYPLETLDDRATSVPIGNPITNTTAYVLDHRMQLVPPGFIGELYLGGAGLARGYVSRADSTAASFVPHPFSQEPGARLYRTGDLVRRLEHDEIDFVGRMDHQVKIRGFRIELREIEAVLRAHPGIQNTLVTTHKDPGGTTRLVAYVVLQTEMKPSEQDLQQWMRDRLPEYMLPHVIIVSSFVLNKNGKIDHTQLPLPSWEQSSTEQTDRAPVTAIEQQLITIWQELLHIQAISPQDNFFALGGHSLLMMQMVSRIHTTLQIDLPIRVLFEYPTLQDLAQSIEQRKQQEHHVRPLQSEEVPIQRREQNAMDDEELLSLLADLSPEEIQQLLDEEDNS